MTTQNSELRAELEHMFASAWQDGVHHLNPKYLRRDTVFTDRTMQLIAERDAIRDAYIIGEDEEPGRIFGPGMPAFVRDLLRDEQRKHAKEWQAGNPDAK